ncbi:MAG: hybrid sensor histidine kinase/response regulator [Magnetococcus sp. YQC-5]
MFNDLDANLQQELIAAFRIELDEKLQTIADQLLQLENNPTAMERNGMLEEIFRAAHSIKGASRGVGLSVVADLSHRLESLFAVLKKRPDLPISAAIDATLATLDFMRKAFEQFIQGIDVSAQQSEEIRTRLTQLIEGIPAVESMPSAGVCLDDPPKKPGSSWRPPRGVVSDTGRGIPAESVSLPPVWEESKPAATQEPIVNEPVMGSTANESVMASGDVEVIHVTVDKLERLGGLTEEIHVALLDLLDPGEKTQMILAQAQILADWMNTMNAINPMDQGRCHAKEAVKAIQSACAGLRHEWTTAARQLKILTHAMRDELHQIRLIKASTLTRPLPRMVRDLARELDKQVQLEIVGDHLVMDRVVLNLLRDPLNHLLRNAVDHGIESPQHRQDSGKPQCGLIRLHFSQDGHRMRIRIQDDGMGMDPEEIARSARRKGIVDDEECRKLNLEQKLELIFRPGFSSREILTTVSGRGIGLDVVKTNLRAIQGQVQVETTAGRGTTFILNLPLTIATERGLLIRVADQVLAIPSKHIDHILLVDSTMKIRVDHRDAILLGTTPTPIVWLSELLGLRQGSALPWIRAMPAVVVSNGWRNVAFLVDDALEDREMVIKPLPPPLYAVPNVAGGAIMGTGQVVMVLDPAALVESALRHSTSITLDQQEKAVVETVKKRILVVDDSITTRTLENNILTNAGFEVQLATHGAEGWEWLQKQTFHLVVTDVQMPIMDGFRLTQLIKTSDACKTIPVIIVSSLGSTEDRQRGVEVGADAYIVKGQFETRALLEIVEQLII